MRIAIAFVFALLLASMVAAQTAPTSRPTCSVGKDHVYACDAFFGTGAMTRVMVPKTWFKKHCSAFDGGAWCDEVYTGASVDEHDAAKVSKRQRLKVIGYGAAAAAVIVVCVAAGGCGFMGG